MEKLIIAGKEFNSRLFLGTGKFNSNQLMEDAILASDTEMVTVAMKRIELDNKEDDMLRHIIHPHIQLLPNTSGVRTAEEAVFAAQMAREAFGTNWLKLEIHPDPRYLLPDSTETLKATEELVNWDSLYCLIARLTRLYVNVWKRPVRQLSCHSQLLSEQTRDCRHATSCVSLSNKVMYLLLSMLESALQVMLLKLWKWVLLLVW